MPTLIDSTLADDNRAAYLANNRIAVGPPGDPAEFRREYARVERLLPKRAPLCVLDIGCGTGAWSVHRVARGCRVTGVDFDPNFLARARMREGLGDAQSFRREPNELLAVPGWHPEPPERQSQPLLLQTDYRQPSSVRRPLHPVSVACLT